MVPLALALDLTQPIPPLEILFLSLLSSLLFWAGGGLGSQAWCL